MVGHETVFIPYSASGSSNGRTTDFGSVYLGSNPSPEALYGRSQYLGSQPEADPPLAENPSPEAIRLADARSWL